MYRIDNHPLISDLKVVTVPATQLGSEFRVMRKRVSYNGPSRGWVGASVKDCQDMLDRGALKQVKRAQAFAERVTREVKQQTVRKETCKVVAGGRLCVAAHLAGARTPFRRKRRVRSVQAPIRVYIDIGCSAGVSSEQVETRGLALLAFAHCLSGQRPVEVIAFSYFRVNRTDVLVKIPLGVKPVNWALAGAVIGHPAFMRDFAFRISTDIAGRKQVRSVTWGTSYNGNTVARRVLSAQPNDVVFGRGYSKDAVLRKDPVAWVTGELDRVLNTETK